MIISKMPLHWLTRLKQYKSGFLFNDLYHWSHDPYREEVPQPFSCSCAQWIPMEYINRSKETAIDQTLGCCQLSEIIRGFNNDMAEAMNSM